MSEELMLDDAAVRWSRTADEAPVTVLLHGYGSDENDLFGLVSYLMEDATYAAVRAPLPPRWPMSGHSWYDIDEPGTRDAAGITRAARALIAWLDGRGLERVGLIGFSQGAAVALQTLRIAPERVRFAANLSGYAAAEERVEDARLTDLRVPVFWGRGSEDEVIPRAAVDFTAGWLPTHSALTGRVYPGLGHAVSGEELDDLRHFLAKHA
ncbi:alpha/beta hydrolase [Microbacterium sp. ZW T5_56]|uniref:alpha/beta hydrolase n=1 Tax=Microbacterium sp. ZW T5_56 TaxID=3378081 RepID=UPI003852BB7B